MSERLHENREQSPEKQAELENTGLERKAELERQLEKQAEKSPERNIDKLKQDAERAAEVEKKKVEKEVAPAEKRRDTPTQAKAKRKASYKATMKETQEQMSTPSRAFSKVIHNPAVEKTSEVVGSTVARPNAILAGSLTAFLFTLGLYMLAKRLGYPLSGFETIAAFILGWVVGLLFDYFRVMITGKKA